MTIQSDGADEEQTNSPDGASTPPVWLLATDSDFDAVDFEAPLAGTTASDCQELSELFNAAAAPSDGERNLETPDKRVFAMLGAIMGMYFKPKDRGEPFGPMMVLVDGRRSAVPEDFAECGALLSALVKRSRNVVLRARLGDIAWLLDRRQGELASGAIIDYTEIARRSVNREFTSRYAIYDEAIRHDALEYLRRALQIARTVGRDKTECLKARELAIDLRRKALAEGSLSQILWTADLDLDFGVSAPADVGADLDALLANPPADGNFDTLARLWELAARAYRDAKREDDKYRCMVQAAELTVAHAEQRQTSAMVGAHFLSAAIAKLHGVPGTKERRVELRKRLTEVQSQIRDEIKTISHEINVTELVEAVQREMRPVGLLDKLFIFASLEISPDPEVLEAEAIATIKKHPLASLFETTHLDRLGKVVARSPAGSFARGENEEAIRREIAQSEGIRKSVVVSGKLEPARQMIIEQHYISDDVFIHLLQYSAFVPQDQVTTFARGFARYFQGDFVSATYILTPLLENALRHVLRQAGHDVTTFDDATQTQEDRTISSLFSGMRVQLEELFRPALVGDIERVFLAKPGPYLRHSLSHGLLHDGDLYSTNALYACWLIFRLCVIPLFSHLEELRSTLEVEPAFGLN